MDADRSLSPAGHVVVVGLMGSGKTTVGRLLASALGRRFVDNDEQLLAATGRTARELHDEVGLDALHDEEVAALAAALRGSDPLVVAAAASVVEHPDGPELLTSAGTVVWLDGDAAALARRAAGGAHRPDVGDAMAIAARRTPLLRAVADVVADAEAPPATSVEAVLRALGRT